jgi:HAD superfamily hydrolase (TIGR01549 family)
MNNISSRIEWVFFDVGSTLTDEGPFEKYMLTHVFKTMQDMKLDLTRQVFNEKLREIVKTRKLGGGGYRSLIKELVLSFIDNTDQVQKIVEDYDAHVSKKYVEMQVLYPETESVLKQLSGRYSLGVVANQPREATQLIKNLGLAQYLKVAALSEQVGFSKPDRRIFLNALEAARCKPEKAMMAGDRLDNDVAPAKHLGMLTVRVKRGMMVSQKPLSKTEMPDYEVCSLEDLISILESLR